MGHIVVSINKRFHCFWWNDTLGLAWTVDETGWKWMAARIFGFIYVSTTMRSVGHSTIATPLSYRFHHSCRRRRIIIAIVDVEMIKKTRNVLRISISYMLCNMTWFFIQLLVRMLEAYRSKNKIHTFIRIKHILVRTHIHTQTYMHIPPVTHTPWHSHTALHSHACTPIASYCHLFSMSIPPAPK